MYCPQVVATATYSGKVVEAIAWIIECEHECMAEERKARAVRREEPMVKASSRDGLDHNSYKIMI